MKLDHNMNATERQTIEWECTKLCHQFANLGDINDFQALSQLFTEDGSMSRPSVPDFDIKGRQTIIDAFLKRPALVIRHIVSNVVIDVLSEFEATGFSLIIFLAAPQSDAPLPLVSGPVQVGEFRDKYVKTADGWKFQQRKGKLALKSA
jgi:hypothetical protein